VGIAVVLVARPEAAPATDLDIAEQGQVVRVVDGDTIIVRIDDREERVRYIGVNAPELASVERGVDAECGALEAALANRELVEGRSVALERDVTDRDRFGRLLRHVWVDLDGWRLVTEALVESGAIRARSYPPDTSRDRQLDAAEGAARSAGHGIWAGC
jgi:micrococcal nuclease